MPADFDHGTCLTDGTCKCDKGWTGYDCGIPCRACANGDCQMDGSCVCREGWMLPDCSEHLGSLLVYSDFADGSDGWLAYNNTCRGRAAAVEGYLDDLGTPQHSTLGSCNANASGSAD